MADKEPKAALKAEKDDEQVVEAKAVDQNQESIESTKGSEVGSDEEEVEAPSTAKAGKRSAKSQREAEAEEARKEVVAERREADKEKEAKPKPVQKRNPLKLRGKAYRAALEAIDRSERYPLEEALKLAKQTAKTKFDSTVELHINLGVDPRQADQMVRGTVVLPAGTGKKLRIAVLAPQDKHAAAKKAGADIVSDSDLITEIEKGKVDFDVLVATPDMMSQLSKVAKVLGPKGLMPNPKSGTVTPDVASAVEQAKAGRVEFRIDKQAIVHMTIGKVSFEQNGLEDNAKAAIQAVLRAKPSAAKGTYVKAASLATSMGPGIKLDAQQAIATANSKR